MGCARLHGFLRIYLPLLLTLGLTAGASAADQWLVGFSRVEVTPVEPVRLSGYAARDKPHTGVADPLFARAMVLSKSAAETARQADADSPATTATGPLAGAPSVILVSVDSIAVVGDMTRRISEQLATEYGISRSDLVICSTHSHAAPHAASGLTNLYRMPLTPAESEAIERNTARVEQGILTAVRQAVAARQPARLEAGQAEAAFAVNRRVLKGGVWSGFGVQADGPVDRRVRLLRAIGADGKLLGAAFMYACHCTTLGPDFNQVSADWAGLSATALENQHAGSVFLPVIGCGADANPEPRRGYDDARQHGAEMAAAIAAALAQNDPAKTWQSLSEFPEAHFGYAGLAPEMPTRAELEALKADKDVARRRWAESMLATWNKMGRLPETYPAPIHTWQFGKELLWVFLGGEVVVDYQIRLEKELDAKQVWVAAYTDDVFAYVASERMRAEGGYEVDFSMVYYNQPGRWQSGTEDLIARRVKEILQEDVPDDKPRTPAGALKSIHVPPGFQVDLLAAEPEVADPVNVSFGHDGRIWVVEMSDYPLGTPGKGRVRYLRDNDGDGRYEESHVFLSELDYPSSAIPWRDGIIVIAAPDVFFAADRDGDGQPEVREVLLQGVGSANPQHRASGFEIGLDGWLNFTSGDGTRELTSTRSGKTLNVSGRDVCWNPDTGDLVTTSGHTQYIRARDEFGNWFGNVNNQPMFHYAIEDAYRSRGGMSGPATQHLLDPPVAPPVFPASRTKDRFNDLFTFNRFTSACSSIICREPGLGEDMRGAAFVCEPVHNLVARFHVAADGSSFKGRRFSEDSQVDWFASSDPFSRPVRIVNAPDGTLWVVDMVRLVIEHPQWIPAAWQERLNIRAGEGLGRIYRVRQQSFQPHAIPRTDQATDAELVRLLAQNDGAVRDLAAQQLLWRATDPEAPSGSPCRLEPSIVEAIRDCLRTSPDAAVRAQALGTLTAVGAMTERDVELALHDRDARVRRFAVRQSERLPNRQHFEGNVLAKAAADQRDPGVLLQLALTLGGSQQPEVGPAIEAIAAGATSDLWLAKALALVSDRHVASALSGMIKALEQTSDTAQGPSPEVRAAVESTLSTLWGRSSKETRRSILSRVFPEQDSAQSSLSDQQVMLLTAAAAIGLDKLAEDAAIKQRLSAAIATARQRLFDEQTSADQRRQLIPLLALSDSPTQAVMADIVQLLGAQETPQNQQAALGVVRRLKSDDVADALLSNWPRYLPDVRSSVSGLLLERRPWGEKLVAALESDKVKVGDLDAALLERLRSYGDRNLMARTARVLGQPPRSDRQALVNETLGKLSHSGDAQRGERLFVEHCAVCHRATPTKPIVGPPLENLSNWTEQQWVVAILDPNRAIEPKYHQYAVVTKEGQSLAGLVEDRSSDSLILAAADGQRHEIKLSEIEQLKDLGISLMPEGIETKLPPAALADLLAYVKTLAVQR